MLSYYYSYATLLLFAEFDLVSLCSFYGCYRIFECFVGLGEVGTALIFDDEFVVFSSYYFMLLSLLFAFYCTHSAFLFMKFWNPDNYDFPSFF